MVHGFQFAVEWRFPKSSGCPVIIDWRPGVPRQHMTAHAADAAAHEELLWRASSCAFLWIFRAINLLKYNLQHTQVICL